MSRFYAACLASYNNGRLHGAWIDATDDADAMQDEVNAMLRASKYPNIRVAKDDDSKDRVDEIWPKLRTMTPDQCCGSAYRALFDEYMSLTVPSAEEWCVHDTDDDDDIGLSELGETSDLHAIAQLVEAAEIAESEFGSDGPAIVRAYWDHVGARPDDAKEAVETAHEAYAGEFRDLETWAEEFLEDTGALKEVPDSLRNYIDFAAWARDAERSGDIFTVNSSGGQYVFWNH
jgi:antirestriction protein